MRFRAVTLARNRRTETKFERNIGSPLRFLKGEEEGEGLLGAHCCYVSCIQPLTSVLSPQAGRGGRVKHVAHP